MTMEDKEIDAIAKISESMEIRNNEAMKDVLEQYDTHVAMNVMINVATSMLAKALILCHPEARAQVEYVAMKIVDGKVNEGHAAVASLMAIGKAMGGESTCKPWVPKNH
jgi:ribonuclease BN (tRNA processing enzyme)